MRLMMSSVDTEDGGSIVCKQQGSKGSFQFVIASEAYCRCVWAARRGTWSQTSQLNDSKTGKRCRHVLGLNSQTGVAWLTVTGRPALVEAACSACPDGGDSQRRKGLHKCTRTEPRTFDGL